MDVREKLVELIEDSGMVENKNRCRILTEELIAHGVTVQECARPLEEWHEDYGDVLWWKFQIEEPPYVGSPLDMAWPGYHTHWTLIPMPQPPKGE